jgi:trehalose-6-phosphate synthase
VQVLVERINRRFATARGGPVVIYDERSEGVLLLKDRLPLLTVADVFVVATVHDGLNRWPFEYVLAQASVCGEGSEYFPRPRGAGVMVLSEFTSTVRVLHGALHVNPWQIDHVAQVRLACRAAEQRLPPPCRRPSTKQWS